MHIVALRETEVTDLRREGLSFLMREEASIMRFKSAALVLDFTAYTRDFIVPKDSSPRELGQVTSVAKQPDSAVQFNGFENVD
jgi:hypothetical protein